ncbi:MAG: mechanosensitive ion channel family protein, partial [Sphingobium sp.]
MPSTSLEILGQAASRAVSKPAELRHMVDTSWDWLSTHAAEILLAIIAGIILYSGMTLLKRALSRLHDPHGSEGQILDLLGRTFSRTTHLFMMLAAARLVVGYANPPELLLTTVRFLFTIIAVFQAAIWAREFI